MNKLSYPENLITDLGLVDQFWGGVYTPLSNDQADGLQYVLQSLSENEQIIIEKHYENYQSYKAIAEEYAVTPERIRGIADRVRKIMRRPESAAYITEGLQGVKQRKQKEKETARKKVEEIVAPGDFTTEGHFIVLAGLNDDGTVKVNDPNSKKRSEKEWDVDRILPQIKQFWVY